MSITDVYLTGECLKLVRIESKIYQDDRFTCFNCVDIKVYYKSCTRKIFISFPNIVYLYCAFNFIL